MVVVASVIVIIDDDDDGFMDGFMDGCDDDTSAAVSSSGAGRCWSVALVMDAAATAAAAVDMITPRIHERQQE